MIARNMCYPIKKSGRIVHETKLCTACGICELVCSLYHEGVCSPSLSRITLKREPLAGNFRVDTCRQCLAPSCYFSCPVNAIAIDNRFGASFIVEEKCVGCRVCAKSCPLNEEGTIIRFNAEKKTCFKCDLCKGRDRGPICVEACPWNALRYLEVSKHE